jgi:allantoin racemase
MKKRIFLLRANPDLVNYKKYAGPYVKLNEDTINRIEGPDVEIIPKQVLPGFWKAPTTVVDYFMSCLLAPSYCKAAIEAEKEGADALIIVCTDDPGLRFVRQVVDIPVIGEYESTLHLACQMGFKFGVIAWPTRPMMARAEFHIREYGLEANACSYPVEPLLEPGPDAEKELALNGYTNPKAFCEKYLVPAAQKLIKRGAEVLVMGSTGMSILADGGGFSKIDDVGVPVKAKYHSVPVLNCVSVSLKMAELMIDLRRATGIPPVSRIGFYQRAQDQCKPEDFDLIRQYYEKDWQVLPMPEIPKPKK